MKPKTPIQTRGFNKENPALQWKAEEFFYHEKPLYWYPFLVLSGTLVAVIPWLISGKKDYISSLVIILSSIGLAAYSSRKPKTRDYALSTSSIHIDGKNFSTLDFAYYWVEEFSDHTQITLVGSKRTAMPISFYLKDKDLTDKVLDVLQQSLPQANPSKNPADWIARKLKL